MRLRPGGKERQRSQRDAAILYLPRALLLEWRRYTASRPLRRYRLVLPMSANKRDQISRPSARRFMSKHLDLCGDLQFLLDGSQQRAPRNKQRPSVDGKQSDILFCTVVYRPAAPTRKIAKPTQARNSRDTSGASNDASLLLGEATAVAFGFGRTSYENVIKPYRIRNCRHPLNCVAV